MPGCSILIPMEVSIVFDLSGRRLEFPFYTLVQSQGPKLMGKTERGYLRLLFPAALQLRRYVPFQRQHVHSIATPVKSTSWKITANWAGRIESYYIVETGQGARTYLGFQKGADVEEFIAKVRRSEKDGSRWIIRNTFTAWSPSPAPR